MGRLSRRYEVGPTGGPGTISTGKKDPLGGVSYGLYQLSTKQGQARAFVDKYYAKEFKGLTAGTKAFNDAWTKLAEKDPKGFSEKQHRYIKDTHYAPVVRQLKKSLDVERRGEVIKDVVWSTSVQHGAGGGAQVFRNALAGKDSSRMTDREIIDAVYAERSKIDPTDQNKLLYFPKDTDRAGLLKRFNQEREDALKALEGSSPKSNK